MDYTTRILSANPDNESADLPPILVDAERPDRSLSYREYVSAVKRIAVGLARHGLADQDAVGLLSDNDIYYYVLGDGVVAAGGIFSGIPTFVKQAELATAIRAAGLQWLCVAPKFLDLALATVREAGLPPSAVLVFDPPGLEPYAGPQARLSTIMDGADEAAFRNANEGSDAAAREAFRFFTSGTTGAVKAAVITHQVAAARADLIAGMPPPAAHFLLMIGMFHISGALYHTRAALCAARDSSTYVSTARDAPAVIDRIQSLGIGVTLLTPPLLEAMAAALSAGPEERQRVASLRQVFFAGALCRQQVIDNIRKLLPADAAVLTGYGATESPGVSAAVITDDWVTGCVGQTLPSTTIKIVDPDTLQEVPPGAAGEVCVRNASTFSRYHANPEATAAAFLLSPSPSAEPGRWFRTGDKGAADPATGALTLLGRFKEIFKVRYEEVAPAEVEGVLLQSAAIADARVASTPARDGGEDSECLAYVVRSAGGAALTAQEVVDFVAARLAAHKAPTGGVLFCEEIPRGAMGKAVKTELDKVVPLPGSERELVVPAH